MAHFPRQPRGSERQEFEGEFTGRIKSYVVENGYGFIECPKLRDEGYQDVFVHHKMMHDFQVGDAVIFEVTANPKGQPQARSLKPDPSKKEQDRQEPSKKQSANVPPNVPPNDAKTVVGRFLGVIKSFSPDNGYGFAVSAKLRKMGYEDDVFVHKLQMKSFGKASAVSMEVYIDSIGRLKARDLHSAETGVSVGNTVLTRVRKETEGIGYVAVGAGTEVDILHVGTGQEVDPNSEWVYVRHGITGENGWLRTSTLCNPRAAPAQAGPRRLPGDEIVDDWVSKDEKAEEQMLLNDGTASELSEIVVGKTVTAVEQALPKDLGYLTVNVGQELKILYIGSEINGDHGWFYAAFCESGDEGWVPLSVAQTSSSSTSEFPQTSGRISEGSEFPQAAQQNQSEPQPANPKPLKSCLKAPAKNDLPPCARPARPVPDVEDDDDDDDVIIPNTQHSWLSSPRPPPANVPRSSQPPPPPMPPPASVVEACKARISEEAWKTNVESPFSNRSTEDDVEEEIAKECPPRRVDNDCNGDVIPSRIQAVHAARELGLSLIGAKAPQSVKWRYVLSDVPTRSFAGILSSGFDETEAGKLHRKVMTGMDTNWERPSGRFGQISRGTKWMVAEGCKCRYHYGGLEIKPQTFPDWMHEVMKVCMPLCGLRDQNTWPNSCNLNVYTDGSDGLDWHADDEPLFSPKSGDCTIISLSLGEQRSFEVRQRDEQDQEVLQIPLHSGDIITMEGHFQKHYVHRVPKSSAKRTRVNLTWRWVVNHQSSCRY